MDLFFVICVSCLSVMLYCLLLAALWSPAGKGLASLIYSYVFVTFTYSVLGRVWYWIVSISDHWLLPYFIRLASFVVGKGLGELVCLCRTVCCIME